MHLHRLAALALLPTLAACPNPSAVPPSAAGVCARIGDQCKLPNGVLGVCERNTLGETRLECMPQH